MQYPLFPSPSLPTPTPRYISCSHFFVPSTTIWTPGTGNDKSHWLDNDLLELNLNCGLAWCLTMSLSNPERLWMVVPSPQFTYMTFVYPQLQSKILATFWVVYVCNQSTSELRLYQAQISGNTSLIDEPNVCSVRRKWWLSQTYFPWRKNNFFATLGDRWQCRSISTKILSETKNLVNYLGSLFLVLYVGLLGDWPRHVFLWCF